jgi:hypothetical protein
MPVYACATASCGTRVTPASAANLVFPALSSAGNRAPSSCARERELQLACTRAGGDESLGRVLMPAPVGADA